MESVLKILHRHRAMAVVDLAVVVEAEEEGVAVLMRSVRANHVSVCLELGLTSVVWMQIVRHRLR